MGLFDRQETENLDQAKPLAARMRPRTLEEFVGQEHFLGEGRLLRRMLQAGRIGSVVFYGPPGTGKTSLAELIAQHVRAKFQRLNAAASGVKELREILDYARQELETGGTRRRCCSLMNCTASTGPSRMCCCRMWKREPFPSSEPPPRTRFSRWSPRSSAAARFSNFKHLSAGGHSRAYCSGP